MRDTATKEGIKMKKEDLMAGIGEIDEKIVDETGKVRSGVGKRKRMKILFSVIAAVLVLSVIGSVVLVMNVSKASFGAVEKNAADDLNFADGKTAGAPEIAGAEDAAKGYSKTDEEEMVAGAPEEGVAKDGEYGDDVYVDGPSDPFAPTGTLGSDGYSSAFILTAAEWRDLDNWAFFMNLVNSEKIAFPAYGIDPRCRVCVTVTGTDNSPLNGEKVELLGADGSVLFSAVSGKDGKAYLFWGEDETPAAVASGDVRADVSVKGDVSGDQGRKLAVTAEDVTLVKEPEAASKTALQVSFIIDTTGSMGDELAFLQKDFASIAEAVGTDGVSYSVNFYRDKGDEYVTKCNPFTSDIAAVKALLGDEFCDGGGDMPEAVDQILNDAITENKEWADDCEKIAFLIFDASPHEGTEKTLETAVRSAAARGIRLIPVVASGSERDTELFGRAIAAVTGGTYVFLTDDSGVGGEHLEPIVGDYKVELLHDVIVRIISEYKVG